MPAVLKIIKTEVEFTKTEMNNERNVHFLQNSLLHTYLRIFHWWKYLKFFSLLFFFSICIGYEAVESYFVRISSKFANLKI